MDNSLITAVLSIQSTKHFSKHLQNYVTHYPLAISGSINIASGSNRCHQNVNLYRVAILSGQEVMMLSLLSP